MKNFPLSIVVEGKLHQIFPIRKDQRCLNLLLRQAYHWPGKRAAVSPLKPLFCLRTPADEILITPRRLLFKNSAIKAEFPCPIFKILYLAYPFCGKVYYYTVTEQPVW